MFRTKLNLSIKKPKTRKLIKKKTRKKIKKNVKI